MRTIFSLDIEDCTNPPLFKVNFFQKLIGKKDSYKESFDSNHKSIKEYNAIFFEKPLAEVFERIKTLTQANRISERQVWDYISTKPYDIHLYKIDDTWSFSFVFSSCAGMADTSKEIAVHWLELWFDNNTTDFINIFNKYGISIKSRKKIDDGLSYNFLPFSQYGYASIFISNETDLKEIENINDENFFETCPYSFDESIMELSDSDLTEFLIQWTKSSKSLDILKENKCYCILCNSDFNELKFEV